MDNTSSRALRRAGTGIGSDVDWFLQPGFHMSIYSPVGKSATPRYNCRMVTTAKITGMTCTHCVRAVFTALAGVPGIRTADVTMGQAIVDHDGTVDHAAITKAVSIAGYETAAFSDSRGQLPVV